MPFQGLTTVCIALALFTTAAATAAEPGIYNVLDFGAKADGVTDDTAAIQAAIDAATVTGGQVRLPAGEYLCKGNLDLKPAAALVGVNGGPMSINQRKGAILLPTAGRGNEDAPPFIYMTHATAVRGVTVYYPEQRVDEIVPYPWTFQMEGFDTTVEDVTLINSYNGLRTGPENNVRHTIRRVVGAVLRRGILVDFCTDIGRIESVQFHCHWWSDPAFDGKWEPVYEFMWKNLEAFVFGRTDWEYATNNFVFPAKIGWRFLQTDRGASNGHLTGCGADSTQTALQVDGIQPQGWLITAGEFVSFMGEEPVALRVGPDSRGSLRLVNCAFWGPSTHNAIIEGDGFVSFSDCYFSNWSEDCHDNPLIVARSGRLQVNNSSFATPHPAVELGEAVRHAIISGNNGVAGVRVVGDTSHAVLQGNEGDPVEWTEEAKQCFRVPIGEPAAARYITGWHGSDKAFAWDSGTMRWSSDKAAIHVPVLPNTAYALEMDVHVPEAAIMPGSGLYLGEELIIPVTETGVAVLRGTVPPQDAETADLRLKVKGWIPSQLDPASTDTRTLGIGARSITFRAEGAPGGRCFNATTGKWEEADKPE